MSIISVFPGKGKAKLEAGSASPLTYAKTYTPSGDNEGFSEFKVNAMPSGALSKPKIQQPNANGRVYATAGVSTAGYLSVDAEKESYIDLSTQSAHTFMPTVYEQTVVAAGTYCTDAQKIAAIPVTSGRSSSGGAFRREFYYGFSSEPSYIAGHCDGAINFNSGDFVLYIVDFVIYDGEMHYTAYDIVDNRIYYGVFDSDYKLTVDEQGYLSVSITEDMIVAPSETVTGIIREGGTIAFPVAYFRYIIL